MYFRAFILGIQTGKVSENTSIYHLFLKRFLDLFVSVLVIIFIFSWLFPLVFILIKATSKGPVLFRQKRTGFRNKTFYCYKFRSMYVNDESDLKQASRRDLRITYVGHFLRATHIDEFPQLFNVLLGNMSLIGPRPHMLHHTELFSKAIPYYNFRHLVKPGITGMSQIKGYSGEIKNIRDLRKRVEWDIFYVRYSNVFLDVKILFKTFTLLLRNVFRRNKKELPLISKINEVKTVKDRNTCRKKGERIIL